MSANFHRFIRSSVLRWPGGRMTPRPVHLNSWEAVYFKHDVEGLKALASAGAEVGVERFVLDDGWFHRRDDDQAALGDWWPDARKYPQGLEPLIDHVRALGLQFGLWVEPEMVNPDSELYRAHPDWALQMAGRPMVLGRHQLVLDLARDEVAQYLFDKLDALLTEHPISYLEWDMNRDLATAALGTGARGRAAYRQHNLALYRLLARVRAAHPMVEIESCSSGGARADAAILRHAHRVWASDSNDALARIGIQSGFLRFLPPEIMGAHIGPERSHTSGRTHTLAFRASVAMFGHLGVEFDVRQSGPEQRRELARWYRLQALHLPGVAHSQSSTDTIASLAAGTLTMSGAQLRDVGLPLPPLPPESAIVVGVRALAAALLVAAAPFGTPAQAQTPPPIPRFVEETDLAGLQLRFEGESEYLVGGGVASFDCDGDGLPEVYVTGGVNKAKFYRNRSARGGPLKLVEERSGLELTNAIGAYPLDVDGDGHIDLVVLRVGEVQVFQGLGQCKFRRANDAWKLRSGNGWHSAFAATWERGAKWPTLAIGTYVDRSKPEFPWGSCTPGLLVRPAAAGAGFADPVPLTPGHCALSMLFSDWNRSGEPALRVSNDREYYKGGQEQLWKLSPGQPPALYTEAQGWKPLQIWGMGIASHDLDGDGFPEVFLTSMSDNKLQTLLAGPDQPTYGDVAYKLGATAHRPYVGGDVHPSTAWHAQFADVNHDGLMDLFIVKGNVSSMPEFAMLDPNNLMLQQADRRFVEVGQQAGIASFRRGRGGLLVDLNGDGLLDMIVVNRWDKAQLWRNVGAGSADKAAPMGHWLQLRLRQAGANRDAVGAWVEVDLGARVVRQELTVGGGHASGQLGWMHFGLGAATRVKLRVQWPYAPWGPWMPLAADAFYLVDKDRGASEWSAP